MILPESLVCTAKIFNFQKEWINHLEGRAGGYSVNIFTQAASPAASPSRTGVGDQLDSAFS